MKKKFINTLIVSTLSIGMVCFSFLSNDKAYSYKADATEVVEMKTLYLDVGGNVWGGNSAKFAVWYWSNEISGEFSDFMSFISGNCYYVDIPNAATNVKFVRFASNTSTPSWDNKETYVLGETCDLTLSDGMNRYSKTGENPDDGKWSFFTHPYMVGINKGDPKSMDSDDGINYSFKGIELNAGDTLQFYKTNKYSKFSANVKPDSYMYENNVNIINDEIVVKQTCTADIYYHTKDGVWVTGLDSEPLYYFGVSGWDNVYAYTWNGNNKALGDWPGTLISKADGVTYESLDLYKLDLPVGNNNMIIFNNGVGQQTCNLSLVSGAYYGFNYVSSGDYQRGEAANFVWNLNTSRLGKTHEGLNNSFCGLDNSAIQELMETYDNLDDTVKGYVDSASVYTYANITSTSADTSWTVYEIISMLQLRGNLINESNFDPSNELDTTTSVIVVSSLLTFLMGSFFFIKKKKEKIRTK